MNSESPITRVIKMLDSRRKEVIMLFLFAIASASLDIAVPLISQHLIDTLISFLRGKAEQPFGLLFLSAAAIILATIVARVLRSMYDYRLFTMVTTLEDRIRTEIFEKYLTLHALFHNSSSSGQIIGRIERGASAVYAILNDIIGHNFLPPLIMFGIVFVTIAVKNIWIALVVFAPLVIYIFAARPLSEKIYQIERNANDRFEFVSKHAYDVAGNVLTVKKFSQELAETNFQRNLLKEAREVQYGAERLWMVLENIQTGISVAGRLGVILIAGFQVINGQTTIGELVLYLSLQQMAYSPMAQLSVIFPRLRRNTAKVERMFGILDEENKVFDRDDARVLPLHSKEVEFKDVWFEYRRKSWALKNISVKVPAGSVVALVGRSGSGKTTFINLLMRSFDPQKGKIFIDGHDLRDVTRESILNQTAVVPQEVDLFSRTILENIAYGNRGAKEEEDVMDAAKSALAHNFIVRTEYGYDTLVGERGIRLSGGVRQRIGIARAVYRDPRILILDEATSHLDTESERLISAATESLMKNRTTFIIAHRLSTILKADTILVFENGRIEAMGPHRELLGSSPTYRKLYELQFKEART